MKYVEWDVQKDAVLKEMRGVGFEDVMDAIVGGGFVDVLDHPNKQKYEHQRLFIVVFAGYFYAVPVVEDAEKIFLKTVYPSRKYTKRYSKRRKE